MNQCSYSTLRSVTTWMGDYLQAGKASVYVWSRVVNG